MVYILGSCAVLPIDSRPSLLVHNASVSPSQIYSSQQPPPPPSRRSTHPTAPTYEHASSFPRQPAPPPFGYVSHNQPVPARYTSISSSNPPPPMTKRAETMPMPVHPTIAPSMPYDISPHPPSRSEMSGGPQPSSQSRSYRASAYAAAAAAHISLILFSFE
jgi:hypothetical protein